MKSTITTFNFLIWAMICFAQTTPTFLGSSSYPVSSLCNNGNKEEYAEFVLPTSDGGFLIVGSYECDGNDWDGRVLKTNATGAPVWEQKPGLAGFDVLRSAVEVSDGYVLAGEKEVNGKPNVWLIKYNFAGSLVWDKNYPNTNPSLSVSAYSITTTFDNNLIVGGATWGFVVPQPFPTPPNSVGRLWVFDQVGTVINSGFGTTGYVVLKVEKSAIGNSYYAFGERFFNDQEDCWSGGGGPQWTIFDTPYFPSSNGGSYGINFSAYYSDISVDKFSSQYTPIWFNAYGGNTPDGFIDGIATPDGGFALLGDTYCQSQLGQTGPNNVAANYPANRYWLLKGDPSGNTIWVKSVGFGSPTGHPIVPRGVSNSCDNNYVLCLDSYQFSSGYSQFIQKHNSGNILWNTSISQPDGYTTDIKRTNDNKFVVVGNRSNSNANNYDFSLSRWGQDGNCNFCTNATPLTCGQTVSGTTATGTNSFGASNFTICSGFTTTSTFNANDKLYSINKTSSAGDLVVTLFSNVDHDIFLFNQCNGTPSGCLGYSDKPVGANGLNMEIIRIPNAPSGTYYIVVDSENTSQQGAFTLTATCGNLSCSGATSISCGQTLNNQSNASASNNVSTYCNQSLPGPGTGCTGKERVYSISVTQQQPVTINLTGIDANEDFELFLLNGCNKDVCIASSTNAWGVQEQIVANLSPGVQYYIVVDGWRETQGNYNLSVNCCPTPTYSFNCGNIVYVQAGTSNPLQYTFSSVGQNIATGFTWQVNNQNVTNATGNSFTHTFPSAGTYEVCFPVIGANGCVEYCCRKYCIAPPVNCETSLLYSFNGSQMVFNL